MTEVKYLVGDQEFFDYIAAKKYSKENKLELKTVFKEHFMPSEEKCNENIIELEKLYAVH
jgi:hypothetical protein